MGDRRPSPNANPPLARRRREGTSTRPAPALGMARASADRPLTQGSTSGSPVDPDHCEPAGPHPWTCRGLGSRRRRMVVGRGKHAKRGLDRDRGLQRGAPRRPTRGRMGRSVSIRRALAGTALGLDARLQRRSGRSGGRIAASARLTRRLPSATLIEELLSPGLRRAPEESIGRLVRRLGRERIRYPTRTFDDHLTFFSRHLGRLVMHLVRHWAASVQAGVEAARG